MDVQASTQAGAPTHEVTASEYAIAKYESIKLRTFLPPVRNF